MIDCNIKELWLYISQPYIKVIIYHYLLPAPIRGSLIKSDKTHTQSSGYTPKPVYLKPEP